MKKIIFFSIFLILIFSKIHSQTISDTAQVTILIALAASLLTSLGKIISFSWKRLFDKEEKLKKLKELKSEIIANYK